MKKKYHGLNFCQAFILQEKPNWYKIELLSSYTKIILLYIPLKKQKLIICSNLIYQRCVSFMQTYHSNRFIQQYEIPSKYSSYCSNCCFEECGFNLGFQGSVISVHRGSKNFENLIFQKKHYFLKQELNDKKGNKLST